MVELHDFASLSSQSSRCNFVGTFSNQPKSPNQMRDNPEFPHIQLFVKSSSPMPASTSVAKPGWAKKNLMNRAFNEHEHHFFCKTWYPQLHLNTHGTVDLFVFTSFDIFMQVLCATFKNTAILVFCQANTKSRRHTEVQLECQFASVPTSSNFFCWKLLSLNGHGISCKTNGRWQCICS